MSWTILVVAAKLLPGDRMPDLGDEGFLDLPVWADKVGHALLFAFETFFLLPWLRLKASRPRPLTTAIVLATGLAVGTEVLQLWVPQRTADAADLLADVVGIALAAGWTVWWKGGPPLPRRPPETSPTRLSRQRQAGLDRGQRIAST